VVEKEVNQMLIEKREDAGFSQRQLADEIGISVEIIKYAERGGRPRPANMKLIADYFGMRVTELFPRPEK
jgi:transcriptional regulator with XRE-family HTH domain